MVHAACSVIQIAPRLRVGQTHVFAPFKCINDLNSQTQLPPLEVYQMLVSGNSRQQLL
jgi:hypothetical protein